MMHLSEFWHLLHHDHSESTPVKEKEFSASGHAQASEITADRPSITEFVVMRQSVFNPKMEVIGYEFSQESEPPSAKFEFERDKQLLNYVISDHTRKLIDDRIAFIRVGSLLLNDPLIEVLAGKKIFPMIRATSFDFFDKPQIERMLALKKAGILVGLADGHGALKNAALADAITIALFSMPDFLPPDLLHISHQFSQQHPALKLGISGIENQDEFDVCCHLNFVFFQGSFIRHREEWSSTQANPGTLRICDMLSRMRRGAELEEIAELIKLDPMISYRILRVANSAAIGAAYTVISIKEAAVIIGREPLYRWLALLLCVTAPVSPGQQALLENALTRGRLMELLAQPGTSAEMKQILFLTGMFSLLDVMLKIRIDHLLSQLSLPPEVGEAIIYQYGPCARLLQLVIACEQCNKSQIRELCAELKIDIEPLNHAQAISGTWAHESAQGF